jgi:hypothetical protein
LMRFLHAKKVSASLENATETTRRGPPGSLCATRRTIF